MFKVLAGLMGVFLVVAAVLFFALGRGRGPVIQITLAQTAPQSSLTPTTPARDVLRVGVAAVLSPRETLDSYQELLDYLGQALGRPTQMIQRRTYSEINDLMASGNIDIAFVCGGGYIAGREEFGLRLLAAPEFQGKPVYYSYIIVPRDSPATGLEQLRGRSFAFTDPLSNSGRIYPQYLLLQMGQNPEAFFGRTLFTYSHDNSIRAVAQLTVEGAAVDSLVYSYLLVRRSPLTAATRIIHISPPFPAPPVVARPNLEPGLLGQIQELLLNMHRDERGARILSQLGIDRFAPTQDSAYDIIRQMKQAIRQQQEGG